MKIFCPENGDSKFLRSIGSYAQHLTASHLRTTSVVLLTPLPDPKNAAITLTRGISAQLTSPRPVSIHLYLIKGRYFIWKLH